MPRPSRLLTLDHLPAVRQVLADHPGVALRKLCEPVRAACALPSMNVMSLHAFLERHQLRRVPPKNARCIAHPQSRLGLDLAALWPLVIVTQEHAA